MPATGVVVQTFATVVLLGSVHTTWVVTVLGVTLLLLMATPVLVKQMGAEAQIVWLAGETLKLAAVTETQCGAGEIVQPWAVVPVYV